MAISSYAKKIWQARPSTATPFTVAELQKLSDHAAKSPDKIKLKELFTPASADLYPAADFTSTAWSDSDAVSTFLDLSTGGYQPILSEDVRLNTQGQQWKRVDPDQVAMGKFNNPTPRNDALGAVMDWSFSLYDDRFMLMVKVLPTPRFDITILVSDEKGVMRPLSARPIKYPGSDETFKFFNVRFASRRRRRFRIMMTNTVFYQMLISPYGVINKTPDVPLALSIADSFREATGMLNVDTQGVYTAESYVTGAISDHWCARTGWALGRLGEGGTGYFNNATGVATNSPGPGGSVPFFSDANVDKIKAYGKNTIRLIEVNGTINDNGLYGAAANLTARVLEGINKVYTWDAGIRFVIVGPEPYNASAPGDTSVITPTKAQSQVTRDGLMAAAAAHPAVIGYVDTNKYTDPFYWGTGYEGNGVGNNGPQPFVTGRDGIHYNWQGGLNYIDQQLAQEGEFEIDAVREQVA